MKKKNSKSEIKWSAPSEEKKKRIRGAVPSQEELLSKGDSAVCSSPCPCKCDDYY